jgi:hypothetical protein
MKLSGSTASTATPTEDTYIWEFVDYEDLGERPAYQDDTKLSYQILASFRIVNYDYDPDEDEEDWNGYQVREYIAYAKANADGTNYKEIWNAPKAKARPFLHALAGREIQDGEALDLDELLGKRMKGTLKLKDNGYPTIVGAVALRGGKKAKAAPKPEPAADADDDGAFDLD